MKLIHCGLHNVSFPLGKSCPRCAGPTIGDHDIPTPSGFDVPVGMEPTPSGFDVPVGMEPAPERRKTPRAPDLLAKAAGHMLDRARTYDQPDGERSMGRTVAAFNAITGRDLTESEAWLLLAVLKMVRGQSRQEPHADSVEDLIAYSALFGECRLAGR